MSTESEHRFSESIEKFFSSGTVVLFTCAAKDGFPLLSVSGNSEEILGFCPSYFAEHVHGWSKRIHPDDRERVHRRFQQIVETGGEIINEYRFKRKDGTYIWLRDEIKLVEHAEADEAVIYGSAIDITDRKEAEIALKENKTEQLQREIDRRKQAEEKLQKRLSYKKAISRCSSLLLEDTSDEALRESMEILLEVTGVDRVFLYKNVDIDGELGLEPIMEMTAEGIESAIDKKSRYQYSEVPFWYEKLSNHEMISAHCEDLPNPARTALEKLGVKSVLVNPITVNQEWYGYIGFSNISEKRDWEDFEVSLLKTAADIIAAFEKRKNIEQSLIEQRNYTETILDSLPSIFLLMDEDLELVQWNRNAIRYTGYSSEVLAESNAFDLVVPEDHDKLVEGTQRVREEQGKGVELRLLTKSGEEIPYFWRGYYIELDGQKHFLCVGIDITYQKETEKDLMDEKRFNEALIESLPGIFYLLGEGGNYYRWNQNFEEVLGYTGDEIEHINPVDLFDDEEFSRVGPEIEKVFQSGQAEIEARIKTKSGEKIPYYLTGNSFRRGEKNYLVGVGHDITEQVEARKKLKESEELFRNLFLKAPAAIVMVNPENQILNINKSFEELFGYNEDELKGRDIDEVIVPEEEYEDAPKMTAEEAAMDTFHKEAKRLTKGGELVDVFVAAIPVFVDGDPLAGFGMYIDITEQKKYEQEIYSSLKEKRVMLKEIHHRVKNNLAVVSGLLQLQMYETDDPMVQKTLKQSENRIQTMALIHEKLYNSQNLARVSCRSYIGDLVETIRNTVSPAKDISVETDIEDIELNINKAVPFALLVNEVVTNSFKHAFEDQGQGKVSIEVKKNEDLISAQIRDNGKGLPDGFSSEDADSLGMTLVDNFAKQLDADWNMGSKNGTYINLQFVAEEPHSGSQIVDL